MSRSSTSGPEAASSPDAGVGSAPVPFPVSPGAQLARFCLALLGSSLVVVAIGLFRLARQFPSAAESPSLLVPFVLPVVALALEAGALVALAVAAVCALVGLAERRWYQRARVTAPLLVAACAALLGAELVPRGTEHPGQFANELVQSALDSCGSEGDVTVPLLGLNVHCGEPRRLVGALPGVRAAQVSMSRLTFSDDLRRVDIGKLELSVKRSLPLTLRAEQARIAGIAPWSRSTRLTGSARLGVLGVLAFVCWTSAVLSIAHRRGSSQQSPTKRLRLLGVLLAGLPGVAMAAGFIAIDQDQASWSALAGAAALSVALLVALRLLVRRVPQMFSSFGGF